MRRVDSYTTLPRRPRFTAGRIKPCDISVQLHVGGLDHVVPALDLLAHIGGRGLRRAADGLGRKLREALPDLVLTQRLVDVGIDLTDDRGRRLRGCDDGEPGRG